jgi:UDP-4-amino-4-deoxy-L-arabinose formyltransferase/UDP-glucuronic acid dehydrogenase (UDP-4-keto-hexauronic acid decarboxylating)
MNPISCVVCAYGHFGCAGLDALRAAGADIRLVFSHADDPREQRWWPSVVDWCRTAGIPVLLDEPLTTGSTALARLQAIGADFIFSFYYRHLLGQQVLDAARRGAYNLHGSLLPKYRGRAPINWQLVHGERRSGVTLHQMVARADAGMIIAQSEIAVGPDQDAYGLTQQLLASASILLAETLPRLFLGTQPTRAQDLSQGSVFGRRTPDDGRIDWSCPARSVHDLVRAVAPPWPGAFTFCGSQRLSVNKTRVLSDHGSTGEPGRVLGDGSIACGSGRLLTLDIVNSQAQPVALAAGTRLSSHPGVP